MEPKAFESSDLERLLTVREAAAVTGLSIRTIRVKIRSKQWPAYRLIGTSGPRIRLSDLLTAYTPDPTLQQVGLRLAQRKR